VFPELPELAVVPFGSGVQRPPIGPEGGGDGGARYEHASDERDALLAQELNRYAERATSAHSSTLYNPIAHVAREPQGEGEVIDLPALSRENDAESSGGETRTLNLAVRSLVVA